MSDRERASPCQREDYLALKVLRAKIKRLGLVDAGRARQRCLFGGCAEFGGNFEYLATDVTFNVPEINLILAIGCIKERRREHVEGLIRGR